MHATITGLLSGKPVEAWYKWADEKWSDLLTRHGITEALMNALENEQSKFENHFDDLEVGQELLAITGIAYYYTHDDGFRNSETRKKAREIYFLIDGSNCTGSVHAHAESCAKLFGLLDDD